MKDYIFKKLKKPMATKKQQKEWRVYPPLIVAMSLIATSAIFAGILTRIIMG